MTMQPVISVEIDQEADAAYVQLSAGQVARTAAFSETINIDLDQHGVVLGIELLDLEESIPLDDIAEQYHIRTEALRTLLESLKPVRSQTTVAGSTVSGQLPSGVVQPSRVAVPA